MSLVKFTALQKLLFLAILTCSFKTNALEDKLIWAYTNFEPYLYMTKNNQVKGSLINLMECINSQTPINYEAINYSNLRASKLKKHKANFAITIKEFIPNKSDFLFSREPVTNLTLRAYWLSGQPQISSWQDLISTKIIVLRGYSYGGNRAFLNDVRNKISVVAQVETHERGLKLLSKRRGDYFLGYQGPSSWVTTNSRISIEHAALGIFPMYFVLAKSTLNATTIMSKLENGLKKCRYENFN